MKNLVLFSVSILLTLVLSLLVLRWLAPGLLGLPVDLQLVQVDEKVPPFFEHIFRPKDSAIKEFIKKDPVTRVRATPFFPDIDGMGPNDLLGFRNREIPSIANIVTIGDSQTYGNNAYLDKNWPSAMMKSIGKGYTHYSMAVGGWAAPQYLDMFYKAILFRPQYIVVAFYTGNDPLESYMLAYQSAYWEYLKPDKTMTIEDVPAFKWSWPPAPEEITSVTFKDGVKTQFLPGHRLKSNRRNPVSDAGYEIMKNVAAMISRESAKYAITPVFTIIPTKELVYSDKMISDSIHASSEYKELIAEESRYIEMLESAIKGNKNASYVDVVSLLKASALNPVALYPEDINGHPVAKGYELIGTAVANAIKPKLSILPEDGLVSFRNQAGEIKVHLLRNMIAYRVPYPWVLEKLGWETQTIPDIDERDIAAYPRNEIDEIDKTRFGPR